MLDDPSFCFLRCGEACYHCRITSWDCHFDPVSHVLLRKDAISGLDMRMFFCHYPNIVRAAKIAISSLSRDLTDGAGIKRNILRSPPSTRDCAPRRPYSRACHPGICRFTTNAWFGTGLGAFRWGCRSAPNPDPPSAHRSAKPSGATLRSAPQALASHRRNLKDGQLFDADWSAPLQILVNSSEPIDMCLYFRAGPGAWIENAPHSVFSYQPRHLSRSCS